MATLFNDISENVSNVVHQAENWSLGHVVLVLLIALVIVFIVMMLMGKKVSLSFLDIRPHRYKVMDGSVTYWKSGTVGKMHNLRAIEDRMPIPSASSYTYHVDVLLSDSRNLRGIEGPYRHIFHRGSDDLYSPASAPPYGLPKRMNPGILLDPNTNDILVFVDTKSQKGDIYRESVRLPDIPLDKPFRLSVSVQDNVLTVNINCRLEITKVLSGIPRPVEHVLYGLCGSSAAQASIQNLIAWPYALPSKAFDYLCLSRLKAFAPSVAPSCGVSGAMAIASKPLSPQGGPEAPYSFKCA